MFRIFVFTLVIGLWSCKSLAQTNLDSTLEDYQQEILGVWVLENDPETKFEYLENGTINYYYGTELRRSENYEVTISCDGETLSNGIYFLKSYSSQTNISCAYIEVLNFEGNNMMSLMTKRPRKNSGICETIIVVKDV